MSASTVEILAVLFFATFIRSALAFGEALIAVPLLALTLPVQVAAPLAVLACAFYSVWDPPGPPARPAYCLIASMVGMAGYASAGLCTRTVSNYFLLSLPLALIGVLLLKQGLYNA